MPGRPGFPRQVKRAFWRLIAAGSQTEAAALAAYRDVFDKLLE